MKPALTSLVKFCYEAGASLVELLGGAYVKADRENCPDVIPKHKYRATSLTDEQILAAIVQATNDAEPPSTAELGRRLGVSRDVLRARCPKQTAELGRAYLAHEAVLATKRYEAAFDFFNRAARTLMANNRTVTIKALLAEGQGVVFSKSAKGRAALAVIQSLESEQLNRGKRGPMHVE